MAIDAPNLDVGDEENPSFHFWRGGGVYGGRHQSLCSSNPTATPLTVDTKAKALAASLVSSIPAKYHFGITEYEDLLF